MYPVIIEPHIHTPHPMQDPVAGRVPIEIWIKIAVILRDYLPCPHGNAIGFKPPRCGTTACSTKSALTHLSALSRTCRFLHDIFSHLLFETVSLGDTFPGQFETSDSLGDRLPMATQFETPDSLAHRRRQVASLTENPGVPAFTRKLEIQLPTIIPVDSFLRNQFPNVTSLRSLTLSECHITSTVVQVLRTAEHLSELDIQACPWDDEVALDWTYGGQFGRSLKKLTLISDQHGDCGCYYDSPRYLHLITAGLMEFEIDGSMMKAVVPALAAGTLSLLHATRLTITITYLTGKLPLGQFLSFCSNVEELHIDQLYSPEYDFTNVFLPHILPRLRSIRGHPPVVNELLARTDIRQIHIENPERCLGMWELPIAFHGLRRLALQDIIWTDDILPNIVKDCPMLTELEITLHEAQAPLIHWIGNGEWVTEIGGLPRLQRLIRQKRTELTGITPNLVEGITYPLPMEMRAQRAIIEEAKGRSCPDLKEVGLSSGFLWIYYPADNGWSPTIRPL